jgi:hypothetical protein
MSLNEDLLCLDCGAVGYFRLDFTLFRFHSISVQWCIFKMGANYNSKNQQYLTTN